MDVPIRDEETSSRGLGPGQLTLEGNATPTEKTAMSSGVDV
jgi:hypothetical protein